jgi:hypothetical protein
MAIVCCNTNGLYAFLHRLTSWRGVFYSQPPSACCRVHAACIWGYLFYRYGHVACKCVNSGTTAFIWDRMCYTTVIFWQLLCAVAADRMLYWNVSHCGAFNLPEMNCVQWSDCFSWVVKWRDKMSKFWALNHCDNSKVMVICASSFQMVHWPFFM